MLERSHLAILRAINQKGSLTAAAESLYLTQPALSHSIKKLEGQLGTTLWQKEGRQLRLTQAGLYLLKLAERILPQMEMAEEVVREMASGQRGTLRIGMECHPCYQWLLKIVGPYLQDWPDVDVDVKQKFQFGGIGALFAWEIDLLVTPDPLFKSGLQFTPVFDYEQVLVVSQSHKLSGEAVIRPEQLVNDTLITYPVEPERLDIFSQFLHPAHCSPRQHKTIETTDIMMQMVAAGRGVAALPGWLADEYITRMPVAKVRLGEQGIQKQIFLGQRASDQTTDYVSAFIERASNLTPIP